MAEELPRQFTFLMNAIMEQLNRMSQVMEALSERMDQLEVNSLNPRTSSSRRRKKKTELSENALRGFHMKNFEEKLQKKKRR